MTEPEETEEYAEQTPPILAAPTANPGRVQVPPEGLKQWTDDGDPAPPGAPEEEA
ncbi:MULTISPECIES: hypothetical protein [Micromonospora]|uniref:Uncharacterized protein n=1 Tax=Micromonospora antibiotica TaxID=2807623 RepID=A0ABS3V4V3_9ACTN|nr:MULTISPECIES: hypothetical protein [Micromonospora]MBO4160640.1 hypothetical protein [Micromonospora antibiotica]MBW4700767.1 hypothetical protein [Micromonospora sp. RL09-050-HVF-A]